MKLGTLDVLNTITCNSYLSVQLSSHSAGICPLGVGVSEFLTFVIVILKQENAPLKGGRGHASMVLKCKLCGRENSIGM